MTKIPCDLAREVEWEDASRIFEAASGSYLTADISICGCSMHLEAYELPTRAKAYPQNRVMGVTELTKGSGLKTKASPIRMVPQRLATISGISAMNIDPVIITKTDRNL